MQERKMGVGWTSYKVTSPAPAKIVPNKINLTPEKIAGFFYEAIKGANSKTPDNVNDRHARFQRDALATSVPPERYPEN